MSPISPDFMYSIASIFAALERHWVPVWQILPRLRGGDHLLAFPNVVADRLLDVDIFAVLHGPDGSQRMPVVRHGDADAIDVLVFECFANVLIVFRLAAFLFVGHRFAGMLADVDIGVADGDDFSVQLIVALEAIEVRLPAIVHTANQDA